MKRFSEFKTNRKSLEEKWERNYAAYTRQNVRSWKSDEDKEEWQSDTNLGHTKNKVTSAYALAAVMLLHGGKYPFKMSVSPWSRIEAAEQDRQAELDIEQSCDEMQKLIQQQLIDCKADRVKMNNILAACVYGETYSKKKVYTLSREGYELAGAEEPGMEQAATAENQWVQWRTEKPAPGVEYVSTWDVFRDLESDNLQECLGIIHRQEVSPYWLRQQKGKP